MSVGRLGEFPVKGGNWGSYIERLEMYFLANKIEESVKLPTLIAVMGEEAYDLLSTLASPKKPSALPFIEAVDLMKNHLQPKPSILAERFRFRQRRQLPAESIADYVADLKRLSRQCEFTSSLEENIRDQFVCGIRSDITRQRLFAEDKLDYKKAVTLALSLEAAEKDASSVETGTTSSTEINKISNYGSDRNNVACTTCGEFGHGVINCRYKNYVCSACGKIGHLRRMCQKAEGSARRVNEESDISGGSRSGWRGARGGYRGGGGGGWTRRGRGGSRPQQQHGQQRSAVHHIDEDGEYCERDTYYESDQDDSQDEPMYQMSLSKYKPVCIKLMVENNVLAMEIDTGTALSCVSKSVYNQLFNHLEIRSCQLELKFYDGSTVRPLGYIITEVCYNGINKRLDLYILEKGTTNLVGRQWLSELNIPINIASVNMQCINKNVDRNKLIRDIFSRHEALFDGTLGRFTGCEAQLNVREGATPIYCRARPVPYALRALVDAELDAMLAAGVVEPVDHSDWATPLVVVRKADGGLRLCADYKVTLNKVLMVDRYPVPKVDDLFSGLSGNQYFSKIDLQQAYNQICLNESSKAFTVINTHRGLLKYNRLVYGLSSSPGVFQRIISNTLNIPDVLVFCDDILIKSKDLNSHLETLNKVLHILHTKGLKIKKSKCEFITNEVRYLGFIIDRNGVRVDPDKIKPIVSMPPPNNISELKSFLGMVNFYGKFIQNLSSLLSPLNDLLRKGSHWRWRQIHQNIFNKVKKRLGESCALAHFDIEQETIVTCDASAYGLGAILSQRSTIRGEGTSREDYGQQGERVVAYASRTLTPAELNYSQIHKEALAIVFAVEKFHQYLYGRNFVLRTDHKPLVSIFGSNIGIPSAAASRLQRWAIRLSAYDFSIEYIRTDQNGADVLSRLILKHKNDLKAEEEIVPEQTYLHFASEALLLENSKLRRETQADPILGRILSYLRDGWPQDLEFKELKPYYNRRNELYVELGCIMWGHRVVVPNVCREAVLNELHDSHMGIVKTKAIARSYVWWPGVDEAVETRCKACTVCAALSDAPPAQPPRSWPGTQRPWSRLHIDFLGPIAGQTFMIIIDSNTKWLEAIRMTRTTAGSVIRELRQLWAKFGIPKQVVSDNGPPYNSVEFRLFLKSNGVEQILSAPYHPASNGAAENAVKTCKRVIKKAIRQKVDVDTALCRFLLIYRNTEHATTGESPANLLQGRNLRTRLDCLKPERGARELAKQVKSEMILPSRSFTPGSNVWYRDYRTSDKWLPGLVATRLGSSDYTITTNSGTEVHKHVDQLKHRLPVTTTPAPSDKTRTDIVPTRKSIVPTETKQPSRKSLSFSLGEERCGTGSEARGSTTPLREDNELRPAADNTISASPPSSVKSSPIVLSDKASSTEPSIARPGRTRKPPVRYGIDFD